MIFHLFTRFVVISLLAFGGGGAALPLVERLAVSETGWLVPQDFAAAVAFGYLTPGPVLITGTFVGYRAAGLSGAVTATVGIFLMPWLLAAAAAQQLQRFLQHRWLAGFGRGAAPAVVGLLGVTTLTIAKQSVTHWAYALIAMIALGLALRTKVHPILILLGGVALGWVTGIVIGPTMPEARREVVATRAVGCTAQQQSLGAMGPLAADPPCALRSGLRRRLRESIPQMTTIKITTQPHQPHSHPTLPRPASVSKRVPPVVRREPPSCRAWHDGEHG